MSCFAPKHDWSQKGDGAGLSGTLGGNAFYKITPGLTGTGHGQPRLLRHAFGRARSEHDAVSRCSIPRHEPFSAGCRRLRIRRPGFPRSNNDRQNTNALPFFSRNIGLVNGRPISLVGGGKVLRRIWRHQHRRFERAERQDTGPARPALIRGTRDPHPSSACRAAALSSPMGIPRAARGIPLPAPTSNIAMTPTFNGNVIQGRHLLRTQLPNKNRAGRFLTA